MATRKLALERGGPRKLQIRWRRRQDFEVAIDGASWKLDRAAVEAGVSLTLPDGSGLFVQRVRRRWWSIALRDELRVERDGVPVPGSDGDPRVIGRGAASLIALFGLLPVLLVGLWLLFQSAGASASTVPVLAVVPLAALSLALAVLAALGVRIAVALGAALIALPVLATIVATRGRIGFGIVIPVLVVAHLVDAWRRMRPRSSTPSLGKVFE